MQSLSEKIDQYLLDLAWSLWTELGVAGVKRRHQTSLIFLEELILLTVILSDKDPRLRDEALDWCVRHHHFVSISRLQTLIKSLGSSIHQPFSLFAVTLNAVSRSKWPVFVKAAPLKFTPSEKSRPPQCELPSLLSLRLRALFGVGARSDLMTFFLTQRRGEFTAADTAEIGYSKRSLAALLEDFVRSGFFDSYTVQNKRYYRFIKRDLMTKTVGRLPKITPPWRQFIEILLPLRSCIQQVEKKSEVTKLVEIKKALLKVENQLHRLSVVTPPSLESDPSVYWNSFADWILKILKNFAGT
ncbi:MAG: hypothetical protein K940chlam6_00727 [Chlamydiae bacterium]|nr:hypothetical protein [Chlamydiota bacterium]